MPDPPSGNLPERDAQPGEREFAKSLARSRATLEFSEAVLAAGAESIESFDRFAAKHRIRPGIGREALAGKNAFPARKFVFERLFFEMDHLEDRIREFATELDSGKTKKSAIVKAVGNRYRI